MRKKIGYVAILLLLSVFTFLSQSIFAEPIDKIIVFGDSLSDNGNVLSLTEKAKKVIPLVPLIPKNPPYFSGRFTNGPRHRLCDPELRGYG